MPLFVSVRVLGKRKRLPRAVAPWALDSGGFSELSLHGRWITTEAEYVAQVLRLQHVGLLAWVAPQDWMCEPFMLERTGLTMREHQARTVASFLSLRAQLGPLVIPVLQGYGPRDYTFHACADVLASADSMAWSYAARREGRDPNSPEEAMRWRSRLLGVLDRERPEDIASGLSRTK